MASVLKLLEDGAWHTLTELAKQTGYPLKKLGSYCEILTQHGILEHDSAANAVRLEQELKTLIAQLHEEQAEGKWEKLGVATIIIPPEKSFQIQKVTIQNLTSHDLQFELRFNKKLREIAVTQA